MTVGRTGGRVLITGAAGFFGSALVQQAVAEGFTVTATSRTERMKFPGVDFIPADILNVSSLSKTFQNVDCVCHVAGLAHIFNEAEVLQAPFYAVNVKGTENVAQAAIKNGVKNFVFISSVSVYGGSAQGSDETAQCQPQGLYAESKLQAERRLVELCQSAGMNLAILRLATLYGEGDPGNVARLIQAIDRGKFIWVGRGENLKSLLHRDDAARACTAVISKPLPGINIYNVSAPASKMKDIVAAIAFALGKDVPSWSVPTAFALNVAKTVRYLSLNNRRLTALHATLQKWLADDHYSTDKFCNAFNYQTKVSLEEGTTREVAWYQAGLRTIRFT